jgi:Flp pilus assembly protein TadG
VLSNKYKGHLDSGAAAVEMALLLPLLLLLLCGIIDFGRGFNAQMQVTQAAREAVRVKALGQNNQAALDRVNAATGGLCEPGATNCPTTTFGGVSLPVPQVGYTVATCSTGDNTSNVSATVSYSFTFLTPLGPLAALVGAQTSPGIGTVKTLSSVGVMKCAG